MDVINERVQVSIYEFILKGELSNEEKGGKQDNCTSTYLRSICSTDGSMRGSKQEENGASESKTKEITLRVATSFAGSDPWVPAWTEAIKQFQEENKGIKITDESTPSIKKHCVRK